MKPYQVGYECPECGEDHLVKVYPYKPAKTWGCYEDNEEADGGYCDPDECKCGYRIEYEDVQEHE